MQACTVLAFLKTSVRSQLFQRKMCLPSSWKPKKHPGEDDVMELSRTQRTAYTKDVESRGAVRDWVLVWLEGERAR
jgi:hypothetical protein